MEDRLVTQGKKREEQELWEKQHPRFARWTDESLPLPIRRRLLLDELSTVRETKDQLAERGGDRPD